MDGMYGNELTDREEKLRFIHEIVDSLDNVQPILDDTITKMGPPFLIFENTGKVEELFLNPSFISSKIEEFSILNLQTKMIAPTGPGDIDAHLEKKLKDIERRIDELSSTREKGEIERTEEAAAEEKAERKEIVEEKGGFGWRGMGRRKIIFDGYAKEYRYIVVEPELTEEEEKIKQELVDLFRLLADISVFDANEDEKKKALIRSIEEIIKDNGIEIPEASKDKIFYYLVRDFIGYGKIDIMMRDDDIEDISCDGHSVPIFVYHRKYQSIESNVKFRNGEELDSFVIRLAQICGKQISIYAPIVDGKLPDGSRLQATLSKTVTDESTFTVRRFRKNPLTPIDLIENNTMSIEMAAYFWLAIENGASILFCGGTGSGKTSTLNALSLFIPYSHKIVSIEDTREVNLPHKNWIAGTTREGFLTAESEKTGKDIDMFDLIRAGLRQRPRVIIVGEVRGREAYVLFQAMATGHTSYATIHADSIYSLIQRLENPPISLPRALLTSLDIIVFINAIPIGKKVIRRITSVTEIIKMDPDTKQLIFTQPFAWVSKVEDRFKSSGTSKVLTNIRLMNGWSEDKLREEINNRIKILEWMRNHNVRSYTDVAAVISAYYKDPEAVLKEPGNFLKREIEEKGEEEKGEKKENVTKGKSLWRK